MEALRPSYGHRSDAYESLKSLNCLKCLRRLSCLVNHSPPITLTEFGDLVHHSTCSLDRFSMMLKKLVCFYIPSAVTISRPGRILHELRFTQFRTDRFSQYRPNCGSVFKPPTNHARSWKELFKHFTSADRLAAGLNEDTREMCK